MKTLDLTEPFIELVLHQNDRRSYEALHPSLFDHYFRYWCPRGAAYSSLSDDEIRGRARRVKSTCRQLTFDLEKAGLEIGNLQAVLFVGGNTSNGHAFRDGDRLAVWIPVESYSSDLLARVFVAHELFHGLHYQRSPQFYFNDEVSKSHFGRQLITEGVATCLTAEVLGVSDQQALWADYLDDVKLENWMNQCEGRLPELRQYCLRHFTESEKDTEFFMANDPDNIMKYRAGYFVGLQVVRRIACAENLSTRAILELDRDL